MGAIASQITSLTIVYSTVYLNAEQRKHQSSESLAFVRGIHRWPVNSPYKGPVTRKMCPFDDVIMSVLVMCSVHATESGVLNDGQKAINLVWWSIFRHKDITIDCFWQDNTMMDSVNIDIIVSCLRCWDFMWWDRTEVRYLSLRIWIKNSRNKKWD